MRNYVLVFDPSGNFYEGKGTTGYVKGVDGFVYSAGQVYSAEYSTQLDYWKAVIDVIENVKNGMEENDTLKIVCEDYRLYASASEAQINSNLETPQLIGAIKWYCYNNNLPLHLQMAAEVKNRWSNDVLLKSHIIKKVGTRYMIGKVVMQHHSMDALRHYLHYTTFKEKIRRSTIKTKRPTVTSNY